MGRNLHRSLIFASEESARPISALRLLRLHTNMRCARRRAGRTPDITHLAIAQIERRLKDAFLAIKYEVHGAQNDAVGAEALAAKDKHEFERWIVGAIEGLRGGKIRKAWTRAIYR